MARDMTAEHGIGSNPVSEILNKPLTRRAALVATGALAAGVAAVTVLGQGKDQEAGSSVEAISEPSIFGKVRERLAGLNIPDKESLIQFVNKLELTDKSIASMVALEESQAQSGSSLVELEVRRLANVDVNLLYPNLSPDEARRRYAEDHIFFLRDHKNMAGIKQTIDAALIEQSGSTLSSSLRNYQNVYKNAFFIDYSLVNSEPHKQGTASYTVEPRVLADASKTTKANSIKATAEAFFARSSRVGSKQVLIRSGAGGEYDAENNVIEVGVDDLKPDQLLAHEYGHFIDDENVRNFSNFYSEQEIYGKMQLKRRLLAQFMGPTAIDKIFSEQKLQAQSKFSQGAKLTEDEFMSFAAVDIDRRFIQGATFFDNVIGIGAIVETSYAARRDVNYPSTLEFVNANSAKIDELAKKNPILKELATDVKVKPQVYDRYFPVMFGEGDGKMSPKSERAMWEAFSDFARLYYLQQVDSGKAPANPDVIKNILEYKRNIGNEFSANALGFAGLYKDRIVNLDQTTVGSYVGSLG